MGATRKALPFHFVDVFAVEPLTGNPLVVGEDAADLPHELLQRIAREFNQSRRRFCCRRRGPPQSGACARLRLQASKYSAPAVTTRSAPGGGLPKLEACTERKTNGVPPGDRRPRAPGDDRGNRWTRRARRDGTATSTGRPPLRRCRRPRGGIHGSHLFDATSRRPHRSHRGRWWHRQSAASAELLVRSRRRRKKTARAASTSASAGRSTRPRGSRRAGRSLASSPATRSGRSKRTRSVDQRCRSPVDSGPRPSTSSTMASKSSRLEVTSRAPSLTRSSRWRIADIPA